MCRQLISFTLLLMLSIVSSGQDTDHRDIDISVGDTLEFWNCEGDNFEFIDLYSKTRFEETDLVYDSTTGEGFYEYFFTTGDFDVHRLTCDYARTKCIITAINYVTDDDGSQRLVIFATIKANEKVAWIEAQEAFSAGEVVWRK